MFSKSRRNINDFNFWFSATFQRTAWCMPAITLSLNCHTCNWCSNGCVLSQRLSFHVTGFYADILYDRYYSCWAGRRSEKFMSKGKHCFLACYFRGNIALFGDEVVWSKTLLKWTKSIYCIKSCLWLSLLSPSVWHENCAELALTLYWRIECPVHVFQQIKELEQSEQSGRHTIAIRATQPCVVPPSLVQLF